MKRPAVNAKLVLSRETVRALGSVELARVVGGQPMKDDTGGPSGCVVQNIVLPR